MATYEQLQKQIEALQAQASELKAAEIAVVVGRIKEAISAYGLTPQDLFSGKATGSAGLRGNAAAKGKQARGAKYADGQGGVWGGRGKRPRWLQEALAAGRKLEEFAVDAMHSAKEAMSASLQSMNMPAASKPERKPKGGSAGSAKRSSGKASSATVKFSDGAGNTWSGKGRRPAWFVAALATGKTPAELSAS